MRPTDRPAARAAFVGAVAGAVVAGGAGLAFAANSSWKQFSSNTVSYRNQASMFSNGHALTTLQRLDHGQAPAGRMGGRARAYFADGTMCGASATRYTTVATTIFTIEEPMYCGNYLYSLGRTYTWNGTDFNSVDTNRTPNIYTGPE